MNNTNPSSHQGLLATPILILLVFASVFGLSVWLPLFDVDEGAFSAATREMLETGNWVSTYLNGEPRHDKPILIYWLQAISVSALGLNPFALRLPSALSALCWLWITYRFVKSQRDDHEARLTVWMLATLPVASVIFKAATADALLNLLLCAAFFDIYRYYQHPSRFTLTRIGIWLGLGFLTKGPIACALPLASSLVLFSINGRWRDWFKAVFHPISLGVFFVIILPWHIAVYVDQGWAFFRGFYLQHNLDRFNSTMEQHGGNYFYYLLFLPILVLPFTSQLWPTFRSLFTHSSRGLDCYLLTWFALTLLIFSMSKTQLPHYMLYGLTPLLILMSRHLPKSGQWSLLAPTGTLLLFSLLPLCFAPVAEHMTRPYDQALLQLAAEEFRHSWLYISVSITGIVVAIGLWWWRQSTYLSRILIGAVAVILSFNFMVLPLWGAAQQAPVRAAARIAATSGEPVVSYALSMPSFSVYLNAVVPRRAPQKGELVFTRTEALESLQSLDSDGVFTPLFSEGGIALYRYE